ncbi:homoserine dehydrogenase [Ignatzschineria cameli]|uniref:Homoserine dehydrogenase n=1 Tax=Ignatzschineria cameli TaxID=2182793 RepID=A0A2U2AU53_9GAMM|nr:homoserine dehydrogenase [Ignatzschineria cameli]PWD88207.1 homoserine dehydrogenase [Ignatzschineria cameli]PWD91236.1 homoserine dehydrogenase [Ignatzschineria cameli]PWD92877.1 homoserine dehydrogenase [Ignatzschineria cameli]PWD93898.1 homoserine dehydrogenase [Ignatzschineria cameli]
MEPLKVGLIGLGTVASGVAAVLTKNSREITRRITRTPIIEKVFVRSLERDNPYNLDLTTSIADITDNPDIDVVIELIGGIEPALTYIKTALNNGKSVITANKELIALHGNELLQLAQEKGVFLRFEASVAGGLPILKLLREGLAANEIDTVMGIINGTSNYILTEMSHKGVNFDQCLKEAQAHGYAEADPTFDIKGIDAAHKLTILAATAFGTPLNFEDMHIEGIDTITAEDIAITQAEGYTIKHLGIARKSKQGIELRVHPTLLAKEHQLAQVDGVLNGVYVVGNAVGEQFYSGRGAGSEATASAVIADLIEIIHNNDCRHSAPALGFLEENLQSIPTLPTKSFSSRYYLAFNYLNEITGESIAEALKTVLLEAGVTAEKIKVYDQYQQVILFLEKTVQENVENIINNAMLIKGIEDSKFIRVE